MIPESHSLDQSVIAQLLAQDALINEYRAFFSLFDWYAVSQWEAGQSSRGRPAHPETAYLKAFLVRIREGLISTSSLRRFLLKHQLLVIALGFHLVPNPTQLYGFDCEQPLPCEQWFRHQLRTFDPFFLLQGGFCISPRNEYLGVFSFFPKHGLRWSNSRLRWLCV